MKSLRSLWVGVVVLASQAHSQSTPTRLLGIVDFRDCVEAGPVLVRPAFIHTQTGWAPISTGVFDSIAAQSVAWSVGHDGAHIGAVLTAPGLSRKSSAYGPEWVLRIKVRQFTPVANPAGALAGRCGPRAFRPVVAITGGEYGDPANWSPFSPADSLRQRLLPVVMSKVSLMPGVCPGTKRGLHFVPTPADLQIRSALRNQQGLQMVYVAMPFGSRKCLEGPSGVGPFWIVLGSKPRILEGAKDLLEIADFDGDGKSEQLFWGGDVGYILFFEEMTRSATLAWRPH